MFVLLRPGNEALGAAVATAISNAIAVAYYAILLRAKKDSLVIGLKPCRRMLEDNIPKSVLVVGIPACLMTLCENISYAVLEKLMVAAGTAAQAGVGVAKKVNMLAHCIVRGMSQGVLPLIGYNYSSGNRRRMRKIVTCAGSISVALSVLCMAACLLFAKYLIGIFIQPPSSSHDYGIAFLKICSGVFERNKPYLHVGQNKTLRFSSPTQFMAQRKSTIEEAWPGDIVGLPDNGIFKIGDTLTEGEQLHFRGLPSFSPEMFKYIENDDPMKAKQLQKGIDQLMDEGVAQLFVNQFNNRKIIGTVGQLQFEVIQYRLENEYNARCRWEPVHLYKACWIEADDEKELDNFKKRKYQYMAKDKEGRDVFLADSGYVLQMAQEDFKHIRFHFTSEF